MLSRLTRLCATATLALMASAAASGAMDFRGGGLVTSVTGCVEVGWSGTEQVSTRLRGANLSTSVPTECPTTKSPIQPILVNDSTDQTVDVDLYYIVSLLCPAENGGVLEWEFRNRRSQWMRRRVTFNGQQTPQTLSVADSLPPDHRIYTPDEPISLDPAQTSIPHPRLEQLVREAMFLQWQVCNQPWARENYSERMAINRANIERYLSMQGQ